MLRPTEGERASSRSPIGRDDHCYTGKTITARQGLRAEPWKAVRLSVRAQAGTRRIPTQGTLCPAGNLVAHDGAEWFWVKRSFHGKVFRVEARHIRCLSGRRVDCGSRFWRPALRK